MKVKSEKDTRAPAEICGYPFHAAHKLKLVTAAADDAEKFVCDGCQERGGAGSARYTCDEAACDFDLHTSCALAPDVLPEHALFKGRAFVLLHEPPPTEDSGERRVCDACGDEVRGFVYHCFDRDLDLHPCCAHLPGRVALGGAAFELAGGRKAPRRCLLCRGEGSRHLRRKYWTYSSDDFDGEVVHLHVACVKKMAYESSSAGCSHWTGGGGDRNMQVIRDSVQAVAPQRNGRFKLFGAKLESNTGNIHYAILSDDDARLSG
ncbi:hypothetical protein E2562_012897 [Oryza meyeriana var. granulata]|uniref:DC1 domain-containing protein n=1 Tax=Oryza meyeriana var. granulata TaxID=110450 RepID=A0A6G1CHG4_9ORYZ|nr:hypothetical protein E2562_012897 [Oryza meyeriana var. granulata]